MEHEIKSQIAYIESQGLHEVQKTKLEELKFRLRAGLDLAINVNNKEELISAFKNKREKYKQLIKGGADEIKIRKIYHELKVLKSVLVPDKITRYKCHEHLKESCIVNNTQKKLLFESGPEYTFEEFMALNPEKELLIVHRMKQLFPDIQRYE